MNRATVFGLTPSVNLFQKYWEGYPYHCMFILVVIFLNFIAWLFCCPSFPLFSHLLCLPPGIVFFLPLQTSLFFWETFNSVLPDRGCDTFMVLLAALFYQIQSGVPVLCRFLSHQSTSCATYPLFFATIHSVNIQLDITFCLFSLHTLLVLSKLYKALHARDIQV